MNRLALTLALFLGAAPLSLTSQTADPSSRPIQTVAFRVADLPSTIQPGSALELRVQGEKSFAGSYLVRRGGYIILPSIGRVFVAGKTIDVAAEIITRALRGAGVEKPDVSLKPAEQPQ